MRLWSLDPRYLDPQGLVALWREGLLARAVLRDETRGYRNHPQLQRFREHESPLLAIDAFLAAVQAEATARGYSFDRSKIGPVVEVTPVAVTDGQMALEWEHLLAKLAARSPAVYERWRGETDPSAHPLFRVRPGSAAPWERAHFSRS